MIVSDARKIDPNDEHAFVPGPTNTHLLRTALGAFTTGVTVVTASGNDGPVGMTVNSFASVSLNPALVLWSPGVGSSRYACFAAATHFAIHVLDAAQYEMSKAFCRRDCRFDDIDWFISRDGVPIIRDSIARFECAAHAMHDGGDHSIIVGRIVRAAHREGTPLCFSRGAFGSFASFT